MSTLDLVVAGTKDAILMIEGFCDFLPEEQMMEVSHHACISHASVVHQSCMRQSGRPIHLPRPLSLPPPPVRPWWRFRTKAAAPNPLLALTLTRLCPPARTPTTRPPGRPVMACHLTMPRRPLSWAPLPSAPCAGRWRAGPRRCGGGAPLTLGPRTNTVKPCHPGSSSSTCKRACMRLGTARARHPACTRVAQPGWACGVGAG